MREIEQIFEKEKYMDLLLEADPEKEIVEKYLKDSDVYGIFNDGNIMCIAVITKVEDNICELKNIATVKEARGKGYGKEIIKQVISLYKDKCKKMIVGTTENNIPFYVKCGFDRYYKTIKNFFVDNYKEPIWDGNLQCIDMYYYYMNLTNIDD